MVRDQVSHPRQWSKITVYYY